MISEAAILAARRRLTGMIRPVALGVPAGRLEMRVLAGLLADGESLTVAAWAGEELMLLDSGGHPTGMGFLDLPLGQEFTALVDAILAASRGGTLLSPLGRQQAAALPAGTDLRVLTTPA